MAGPECLPNYAISFYDRGGRNHIFDLEDAFDLSFNRVRDDISAAQVHLNGAQCQAQANWLEKLEPGRHEMVVWRGGERAWEGPVIGPLGYMADTLEINAQDVMYYAFRTVLHQGYSNAYPNITEVTTRCSTVLTTELARKEALDPPINVVPFIVVHHSDGEARTSATTDAYSTTVFGLVDDAAAKSGIDYTVVGRAIHLWDTSIPIGYTPVTTENDYLGKLNVSVYGSGLATAAVVTDGQGGFGYYPRNPDGTPLSVDPYYGEWEVIAQPYDQDNTTAPTQAEMDSQAQRNVTGKNPTPVEVRIPDNSQINPDGVLDFSMLVPGVWIPLVATTPIRKVNQMQKLDTVSVKVDSSGEKIMVTMSPAGGYVDASDD